MNYQYIHFPWRRSRCLFLTLILHSFFSYMVEQQFKNSISQYFEVVYSFIPDNYFRNIVFVFKHSNSYSIKMKKHKYCSI